MPQGINTPSHYHYTIGQYHLILLNYFIQNHHPEDQLYEDTEDDKIYDADDDDMINMMNGNKGRFIRNAREEDGTSVAYYNKWVMENRG